MLLITTDTNVQTKNLYVLYTQGDIQKSYCLSFYVSTGANNNNIYYIIMIMYINIQSSLLLWKLLISN